MKELSPSYYFDLAPFAHRTLFDHKRHAWEALSDLKAYLLSLRLGSIEVDLPEGVFLEEAHLISIGEGTRIEPGAYIKGPCWIGSDCVIRYGAYIRGHFLAGDRCVIGHATEVKHSVFFDDVRAGHFNYIGDSIVGNDCNLGAGVKCANLKLDQSTVQVSFKGQKIETGLGKLGAVIGDATQIGCNTVTNPGTCLGKQVICYACINVGGFFPSGCSIKGAVHLYTNFSDNLD